MSVVAAVFLFGATPAHATAPTQLIAISPSSTEISADPGGSTKGSFDVVNEGTTSFKLSLSAAPYNVQGLNYDPSFTQLPGTVDPSKWIKFNSVTTQDLASKKLLAVDYTVNVPAGTAPGGYYAVIFAQSTSTDTKGVIPQGRVGNILYISVSGTVKVSGTLSAGKIPFFNIGTPVSMSVIVENDGGLHFQTTVNFAVKDIFGKTVLSKTDNRYVLPQTERQISETWTPNAPIGLYYVERSASLPDVGTKQLTNRIVIVVQPWVFIALAGLILVIIAGIMLLRLRKRRRLP